MIIDIKEVLDYCYCPMLYKFNNENADFKNKNINLREKYNKDIHSCAYAFFALIQNEDVVSLSGIKRTWGTLWIGDKSATDIVYAAPLILKDSESGLRKKGIATVINIYNKFKDNPGLPIMINKKYIIDIGDGLRLTGSFEIVREVEVNGEKIIELIDFKTEDKTRNTTYVNNDLEITSSSLAYETLFEEKLDRVIFYGLDKNKMVVTKRNEEDYNMLKHTVKMVSICIKNNIFYVAPGTKCFDCIYKKKCIDSLNIGNML